LATLLKLSEDGVKYQIKKLKDWTGSKKVDSFKKRG
jgi:hypothetical protein